MGINIFNDKKRQHYVWKKYLRKWEYDFKIECLKNKKNLLTNNIKNVVNAKYFYSIQSLQIEDFDIIRKIYNKYYNEKQKGLVENIREIELMIFIVEKGNLREKKEINKILNNLLEEIYCNLENIGFNGLNCLYNSDLSFMKNIKERNNFILFLTTQFYRTKKMKDQELQDSKLRIKKLKKVCSLKSEDLEKYIRFDENIEKNFNIIALILANYLSNLIIYGIENKILLYNIIENKTSVPFITSDQPVIITYREQIKSMEIYYPISPDKAFLITDSKKNIKCNDKIVEMYNKRTFEYSYEWIFANKRECIINCVNRKETV